MVDPDNIKMTKTKTLLEEVQSSKEDSQRIGILNLLPEPDISVLFFLP